MAMKKSFVVTLFLLMFVFSACYANTVKDAEKKLREQMPYLQVESVSSTDMEGLYEVVSGDNIYYYHPGTGNFIFGDILNKDGQNVTGAKRAELAKKKLKNIDQYIGKAVQIGNGKNLVVEFTDPDCPFCRRGYEYFSKRDDITKMVFFLPLPIHPDAENKAKYILCAKDREKAYKEALSGQLDNVKYEVCNDKSVDETLKLHKELAAKLGINGTPAYVINGELVVGINVGRIEQLIGQQPPAKTGGLQLP